MSATGRPSRNATFCGVTSQCATSSGGPGEGGEVRRHVRHQPVPAEPGQLRRRGPAGRGVVQLPDEPGDPGYHLVGAGPGLGRGTGHVAGDEVQNVAAAVVDAEEARRAAEADALQVPQVRGDERRLLLPGPADRVADPDHAVGDIALRQRHLHPVAEGRHPPTLPSGGHRVSTRAPVRPGPAAVGSGGAFQAGSAPGGTTPGRTGRRDLAGRGARGGPRGGRPGPGDPRRAAGGPARSRARGGHRTGRGPAAAGSHHQPAGRDDHARLRRGRALHRPHPDPADRGPRHRLGRGRVRVARRRPRDGQPGDRDHRSGGAGAEDVTRSGHPAKALTALRAAGVDVVTLANNHAVDYGATGLQDTLAATRTSRSSGSAPPRARRTRRTTPR